MTASRIRKKIEEIIGVDNYLKLEERLRRVATPGLQSAKAAELWANLSDFEDYYNDPLGQIRSEWVADQVGELGIQSVLEIGSNSGRNLAAISEKYPATRLKGIDVNQRAISFARQKNPQIAFEVVDANQWIEAPKSWDATLTMSLIDHIPDESVAKLACNMCGASRKYVICVELWDGSDGWRALYKYSRDLRKVFEQLGVKTVHWKESVGQYNLEVSALWSYVGDVQGVTIR